MSARNRPPLDQRVTRAAEDALAERKYACVIDVLLGLGWLNPNTLRYWQQGRVDCLEDVLQINPARLSEAIHLFTGWARQKGLAASEASYVARTPQRQPLRFGRSGDDAFEALFRTHWLASDLSAAQQRRLEQKATRPPGLVVIVPLNDDWTCHRCGQTGDLLVMEPPGPACLRCVGLDDLVFLPSGDALLTRRVSARSQRKAVVVRFARRRKRYERQGLLVEPGILAELRRELGRPADEGVAFVWTDG
jgi:hypothetical protein